MNEDEFRARLTTAQQPVAPGGCPEPERLLALADGSASEVERFALLDHVSRCPACREELELLRMIRPERPAARRPAFHWRSLAVAAAAVFAVGLGLRQFARESPQDGAVLRGPDLTRSATATDTLSLPLQLRWRAVPEAVTYAVEVLETDGTVRFSATVSDTVIRALDATGLVPGHAYDVTIRARRMDGRDSLVEVRRIVTARAP